MIETGEKVKVWNTLFKIISGLPKGKIVFLSFVFLIMKCLPPLAAWFFGLAVSGVGGASVALIVGYASAKILEALLSVLKTWLSQPLLEGSFKSELIKAYDALANAKPQAMSGTAADMAARADCASSARYVFAFGALHIIPTSIELIIACIATYWIGATGAAVAMMVSGAIILFISLYVSPRVVEYANKAANSMIGTKAKAGDLIPMFLEAKAFGREEAAREDLLSSINVEGAAQRNRKILDGLVDASYMLATGVGALAAFMMGVKGVEAGTLSQAAFVASVGMATSSLVPISQLGWAFREMTGACVQLNKALDLQSLPKERVGGEIPMKKNGPFLNLEEVCSKGILKNLNISFDHGEKVMIVGPSGAGKSSLIDLLMLFKDVDSGRLSMYGVSESLVDIKAWRKVIGWVPQIPGRKTTTAYSYISEGNPGVSKEEGARLLRILNLKINLDEMIGPKGRQLSGGEWQRMACARALACDTEILLLDEPSSALDAESEERLMDVLLKDKRTVIAVSHRLGRAKDFDRVLVMDNGRIVQDGTHVELLEMEGLYKRLATSASLIEG